MYEKLTELISEGNYNEALYELQEEYVRFDRTDPHEAAGLCVLEATLWELLNDSTAEFDAIRKGLGLDPYNYELFYMLSLFYRNININKSYLCAEMALFYCDNESDQEVILEDLSALKDNPAMRVRDTAVVILSYNDSEILKDSIESVEKSLPPENLEIVVVDNASTDPAVIPYLREKAGSAPYTFRLIENSENLGFAAGCNIGAVACSRDKDIFFLNNDAVLMPNSLFFLRMGLYEKRDVGACSALSNSASLQEIPEEEILPGGQISSGKDILPEGEASDIPWHRRVGYHSALEIFKKFSASRVVPVRNPYLKCFRLTGFALLVSRDALQAVAPDGKVFDEYFSPAYFEDDDLGIRIAVAGFEQYLCTNSLIYHNGGSGFDGNDLMEKGRQKFIDKWGFDVWGYCVPFEEGIRKILSLSSDGKKTLRIIDFTCGLGATAAVIKRLLPASFVAGVCPTPFEAGIASRIADDVAFGDLNSMRLPWEKHSFDVAITEKGLVGKCILSECLKKDGVIISDCSAPECAEAFNN